MTSQQPGAVLAAETIADFADRVYGLHGGHIQPVWDALIDTTADVIATRDERAAVHAAHAEAMARDTVGVATVTAGPGFLNGLTGMGNASTSGVPVLVITGMPPTPQIDRGALQDVPQQPMIESITSYAKTVREANRLPEYIAEAAGAAVDNNGPAFLQVPFDVWEETAESLTPLEANIEPFRPSADADSIEAAATVLEEAERPMIIAGRGTRSEAASAAIREFVETTGVPFFPTSGARGVLTAENPLCIPGSRGRATEETDAVLLLGKRTDYVVAYASPAIFGDADTVQIDVDAGALRQNRRPEVAVHGTVTSAVQGLTERLDGSARAMAIDQDWVEELRENHEDSAARIAAKKREDTDPIHPYRVCGAIEASMSDDTMVICDGGDALSFGRVGLPSQSPRGYLDPGPLGCIGIGVPYAIGSKLARPERDVVCFTGDGSLGFNVTDLETAARYDLDITVVVSNNAAWNIDRYDQREEYGRTVGTSLSDIRFDTVAEGFGAEGIRVDTVEDLDAAVADAMATSGPVVVDVSVDPDAVSPDAINGLARLPRYQAVEKWDSLERERREH